MISARKLERLFDIVLNRRPEFQERRDFNKLNKKLDEVVTELKGVKQELQALRTQPVPNYVITGLEQVAARLEAIVK